MNQIIHTPRYPGGRRATEQEIAAFLSGLTAADGTSYLDTYNQALADEQADLDAASGQSA